MVPHGRLILAAGLAALAGAAAAGCRAEPVRLASPPVMAEAAMLPRVAPPARREIFLGRSAEGRDLTLRLFGTPSLGAITFVLAGIHGDEPVSVAVAERLTELLRDRPDLVGRATVGVLACANPDGLAAGTRMNARGVDLNRNFPARNFRPLRRHGPAPASESETRALLDAMRLLGPDRIVSIHTCPRGQHGVNYDGPAEDLARAMGEACGYRAFDTWHSPTPGSLGSYAGLDLRKPVITLEIPRDLGPEAAWRETREALLAAIQAPGPMRAAPDPVPAAGAAD